MTRVGKERIRCRIAGERIPVDTEYSWKSRSRSDNRADMNDTRWSRTQLDQEHTKNNQTCQLSAPLSQRDTRNKRRSSWVKNSQCRKARRRLGLREYPQDNGRM